MKIISAIENSLDPQHLQKLSQNERLLLEAFLNDHDKFLTDAKLTGKVEHQDGICERWRVNLSKDFAVFIDCSTPGPSWGTSSAKEFYRSVQIVGYECSNGEFLLSSWISPELE